jgi:hypothetical protein
MKSYSFLVKPKLPNTGLGNRLIVWARAILFAELNSVPVMVPDWFKFRLGPYLRGEKDKRMYGQFFQNHHYLSQLDLFWKIKSTCRYHYNPEPIEVSLNSFDTNLTNIFVFDTLPDPTEYFKYLKGYQPLIRAKLFADIRRSFLEEVNARQTPEIGIHLRLGDFKSLEGGIELECGNTRTPLKWFIQVIHSIRNQLGRDIPVTIFSDGYEHELKDLLNIPGVVRPPNCPSLSDLITLSRSKLLIASAGSSFSSWASYLGQCPTIWHPAQFKSGVLSRLYKQEPILNSEGVFEGGFDPDSMEMPGLLLENINRIFASSPIWF